MLRPYRLILLSVLMIASASHAASAPPVPLTETPVEAPPTQQATSDGYPCSSSISIDGGTLYYCGDLNADAEAFFEAYLGPEVDTVIVTSRGGLERSAMHIQQQISASGAALVIRDICLSACAHFLFLPHGRPVTIEYGSIVGFHHTSVSIDRILEAKDWFGDPDIQPISEARTANLLEFYAAKGLDPRWLIEPHGRLQVRCVRRVLLRIKGEPSVLTMSRYGIWIPRREMIESFSNVEIRGYWLSIDAPEAGRDALVHVFRKYSLTDKVHFGGQNIFLHETSLNEIEYCEDL